MKPKTPAGGMRQLAAHGFVYVFGTALQGLGVLMVTPFVTRTLSRADFGRVSAALVVIQLVGTIAAAGLPQVILREYHRLEDGGRGARALVGTMFLTAMAIGVVGAAAVSVVWLAVPGVDLTVSLLVVGAASALTGVVAGQSLMRARGRPWHFLAMALLSTVCAQVAGLLSARANPSPEAFLSAYGLALALAALVSALLTRPLSPRREWRAVRHGLRLAAPLLPHAVAMLVLLMGDVMVVAVVLGSESVATYQVALMLGNMPFVLSTALVNAWAPAVLARSHGDRWEWTRRSGAALALLVAVGSVGVALLGPWLGTVAAPRSFDLPTIVVLVALISSVAPAYLLYNGASLALIDGEATGRLAWAAVASSTALVGMALVGALAGGVVGVATARLAGYLVLTVGCAWLARRYGLRWGRWQTGGIAVFTAVLGIGAGALLPVDGTGATIRLVLALLLGLGVLFAGQYVLRRRGGGASSRIAVGRSPGL